MASVNEGHQGGVARVRLPAIAIPVEGKDGFECPYYHVERLEDLLPRVDRVLCIGWKARETDFLELLEGLLAQRVAGLVVTNSQEGAIQVRQRLDACIDATWAPDVTSVADRRVSARPGQLPQLGGFSRLVASGVLQAFLGNPSPSETPGA